jgi:hypothetical protein
MAVHTGKAPGELQIKLADIKELVDDIGEVDAAAVLATGATRAELEQAVFYARGYGDVVDRSGHPLTGAAAQIFEILTADQEEEERR